MLHKASLKKKLIVLCLSFAAVTLIVGGIGVYNLGALSDQAQETAEIDSPKMMYVSDELAQLRRERIALRDLTMPGAPATVVTAAMHDLEDSQKTMDADQAKIEALLKLPGGEDGKEDYQQVEVRNDTFEKYVKNEFLPIYQSNTPDRQFRLSKSLFETEVKIGDEVRDAVEKALKGQRERTTDDGHHLVVSAARARWTATVIGICGVLLSLIAGVAYSQTLARELNRLASEISQGSVQVAAAAGQISASSQTLSGNSTEQASSIEETSASLQELGGMVESNLKNAESALQLSEKGKQAAERGSTMMAQLIESMTEILGCNKRIEGLVKVIEEIGEKTEIIDEIVFQTKLLSFNASVEAERAGDHGRGFAVVAQEVGNLAQMSGKAATEIANIVKGSIKDAQTIAVENKEKVERGNHLVQQTAEQLVEIRNNADNVTKGSSQIVSASNEQALGIRQINKAMDTLNQTTQQTAAHAEEAAGAGEEMSGQADTLKQMSLQLTRLIHGANAQTYDTAPIRAATAHRPAARVIAMADHRPKTAPGKTPAVAAAVAQTTTDAGPASAEGAWERL